MKLVMENFRKFIKEAQWGGFTGGAAPLDEPASDSGTIPPDQLKKLWGIFTDMGMSPEEILQTPEFVEAGITDPQQLQEIVKENYQEYKKEYEALKPHVIEALGYSGSHYVALALEALMHDVKDEVLKGKDWDKEWEAQKDLNELGGTFTLQGAEELKKKYNLTMPARALWDQHKNDAQYDVEQSIKAWIRRGSPTK